MQCSKCSSANLYELPKDSASDQPKYRCFDCDSIVRIDVPHPCPTCKINIVIKTRTCSECHEKAMKYLDIRHKRSDWINKKINNLNLTDMALLQKAYEDLGKQWDKENENLA